MLSGPTCTPELHSSTAKASHSLRDRTLTSQSISAWDHPGWPPQLAMPPRATFQGYSGVFNNTGRHRRDFHNSRGREGPWFLPQSREMEWGWPNLKLENPEAPKGLWKPDLAGLSPPKMGHGCTGMSAEMRQGMQVGQGVWPHSLLPPSPSICACPQDLVLMSEGSSGQPSLYSY